MDERDWLAERFEEHRTRLRAVAYRMLGSLSEADDAVQEAWIRLSRTDTSQVENLGGWLTTVVARVSLNMLRSRDVRREEPLTPHLPDPIIDRADGVDPEHEALLAAAASAEVRGTLDVARQAVMWSRVDLTMHPALVNGAAGMVATRNGVVFTIASVIVRNGKIAEMDFLADPERLARLSHGYHSISCFLDNTREALAARACRVEGGDARPTLPRIDGSRRDS